MPANWLKIHKEIKEKVSQSHEIMLFGGAGSSKTWTHLHTVVIRAGLLEGSRHLCVRKRFEHAKASTWNSLKEMVNMEWPGLWEECGTNKGGGSWVLTLPNSSEIHVGGLDDKERIEKWLGSEWATIYLNEVSEIADEKDVELISSRLRQKINGRHLLLLDMNPPSKKHWSYERYMTKEVDGRVAIKINPIDVKENLPESYIKRLEALPDRLRQRFLHGEFTTDVEGALWSWDTLESAKKPRMEFSRVVVGVDPAVTSKEDSDETGIVVVGQCGNDEAHVIADYSGKYKPSEWAEKVVDAYELHQADAVIAETNQGGDLVEMNLRNARRTMNVKQVRATRGKHIRAEPIAALYEQGKVSHGDKLEELEDQMLEWVPGVGESPDRVDALVWALTELLLGKETSISFGFI